MLKPKNKSRIAITMGDPSGIGPEITALALSAIKESAEFTIIGDRQIFQKAKAKVKAKADRPCGYKFIDLANVNQRNFKFGRVSAEYGRASVEYLDKALELIGKKEVDSLVTCPISKESVNKAGFVFSGHTEYLAEYTGTKDFVMMLLNNKLKVSLVTRHIPLAGVAAALDKRKISSTIALTHWALKKLFLIKYPRIAVCGMNPHASDNGLIGKEEQRIILPALRSLGRSLKGITGPLPADVAIAKAACGEYDCIIAIYHDQALIPLKLSSPQGGVNITLGLPFVRTSPLHGTAFDIAGRGKACPDSLLEAIKLAIACSINLKISGQRPAPQL
jgi:4-hydroxythreonine-4-phosphate dehydrogenase